MMDSAAVKPTEWAVLFVRTGSENGIVETLKRHLDSGLYTPFTPTREWAFVKRGKVQKKDAALCFPGYVFLEITSGAERFYREAYHLALAVAGVYRFLHYSDDSRDIFMREHERAPLERFLNENYCMEGSVGSMEDGRVSVTSGALVGMDERIWKVNKSKRTAVVDLSVMGERREITLMLEIVKREAV